MANEMQNGPLVALVLLLSQEIVEDMQDMHDTLFNAQQFEAAKSVSARMEQVCMLQGIVSMSGRQSVQQTTGKNVTQEITAYLQANDPTVFPIYVREDGKYIHLNTSGSVSIDTANWLDTYFPDNNVVLNYRVRTTEGSMRDTPAMEQQRNAIFPATRNPGFIPERQPTPPRPDNAPLPHKPEINHGMPMAGEQQGMPGGRLGDKA